MLTSRSDCARTYRVTLHVDEEMDEDGLCVHDVERVLLTGRIVGCQRDRRTRERSDYCPARTKGRLCFATL